jgi:16S rRNA (guanine527-N7)-methyltransferase
MKIGSSAWKEMIIEAARELDLHVQSSQVDLFAKHASLLTEWNQKMNLTTIVDPAEIAIKHFLDAILSYAYIHPNSRLMDVGSGAGFPGIALKVMIPTLKVTLIEATHKKVSFLKHVIRELDLTNIEAIHTRIENLARRVPGKFDVIVSRAFSNLSKFVELSLPYLAADGQLITYKAKDYTKETQQLLQTQKSPGEFAENAYSHLDFELKIIPFQLPVLNLSRTLMVLGIQNSSD